MHTIFSIIWGALLGVILIVETVALLLRRRGDTLSEQVWWLRNQAWARCILFGLWAWLTWHFFVEPTSMGAGSGVWADDITITAAAALLGLLVRYKRV